MRVTPFLVAIQLIAVAALWPLVTKYLGLSGRKNKNIAHGIRGIAFMTINHLQPILLRRSHARTAHPNTLRLHTAVIQLGPISLFLLRTISVLKVMAVGNVTPIQIPTRHLVMRNCTLVWATADAQVVMKRDTRKMRRMNRRP